MNKLDYCPFLACCPHEDDMCHSLLPYKKCWSFITFINYLYKLHKMKPIEFLEYIGAFKDE